MCGWVSSLSGLAAGFAFFLSIASASCKAFRRWENFFVDMVSQLHISSRQLLFRVLFQGIMFMHESQFQDYFSRVS